MLAPYRSILTLPGARAFMTWGLLARAQMAMTELGILLMVQIEYDSYAMAGRIVALVAIAWAILGPIIGRLVDRYGQRRVLRWGFAIAIAGRIAMIIAAVTHQPEWVFLACAPLLPATGSISAYTRARWSYLVKNDDSLNTAFSLESSLDEVVFIAGPALTTVLSTLLVSWAGFGLATATLAIGGYALLAQTSTEPPAEVPPGARGTVAYVKRRRALLRRRRRGTRLLVTTPVILLTALIFAAQGALFASADIATVAFADEGGHKAASGLVLAVFALGSLLGGLLYGARVWRVSLASRLVWGVVLTGIGAATFGLAPTLAILALIMFITGLVVAPTMAVGDGLVQALIPRNRLTEGMTWTRAGIDVGIAGGALMAGLLVEQSGSSAAFLVTGAAGLFSALITIAAWPYLRSRRRFEESFGDPAAPGAT